MPNAKTVKEAKAAYKTRRPPELTEREKREAELERRAWVARQREKHRLETTKKRADKEKKQREADRAARLGSQRRCDKYGYQSSQFHLGAFFGRAAESDLPEQRSGAARSVVKDTKDSFDEDMDDETLLEALRPAEACIGGTAESAVTALEHPAGGSGPNMLPPPRPLQRHDVAQTPVAVGVGQDTASMWEGFLDSSTQIAWELSSECVPGRINVASRHSMPDSAKAISGSSPSKPATDASESNEHSEAPSEVRATHSFDSSHSFDLTAEEWEELDPTESTPAAPSKLELLEERGITPPPTILSRRTVLVQSSYRAKPTGTRDELQGSKPASLADSGLSLSQLETFIDDDLVLTQVDPV